MTENVEFQYGRALDFFNQSEIKNIEPQIRAAHEMLHQKTGAGSDFLGWVDLPVNYDKDEFARIKKAAEKIREDSDVLVVIGIGGSYLGAKAAIDFLNGPFYNQTQKPQIIFAGNNISPNYFSGVFSQEMGQTFVEYLTEKRMERAKELLRYSGKRSSEVAYEVGYRDPRYFSFLFKKTQGCTPSSYRAGNGDGHEAK